MNDRVALSEAEQIMKKRINEKHMRNGVTIIDPANTYIGTDVEIGQDTVIYPGTVITGKQIIGSDCIIGPNTEIENCKLVNDTIIRQSVAHDSQIGSMLKLDHLLIFVLNQILMMK